MSVLARYLLKEAVRIHIRTFLVAFVDLRSLLNLMIQLLLLALVASAAGLRVPMLRNHQNRFGLSTPTTSTLRSSELMEDITAASTDSDASQSDESAESKIPLQLIIAGAPASGKGTQCEVLKDSYDVIHLSTGDILRAAVKEGSNLGVKAKEFMDSGALVPDELITGVVVDRLQQPDCVEKGWLLDGFPRTAIQAEALQNAGMDPDCFILLDVPQDILVERVTGRRTDPETGKIYHMTYNPPPSKEIEDRLVQRSDDTAEKIVLRYQEFQGHVDSVKSCYEDCVLTVDGTLSASEVTDKISVGLDEIQQQKITKIESERSLAKAKNKQATNMVMGMYCIYSSNILLAKAFKAVGISFPPPLVGMILLFSSMCAIDTVKPAAAGKLLSILSPTAAFLKIWLPVLLLPPLVVAPMKAQLFKDCIGAFIAIVFGGTILSLGIAGKLASVGKTPFPAKETESDPLCADVECTTGASAEMDGVIAAPMPTLPSFKKPMLLAALALASTCLFNSLGFVGVATKSQRIFGTITTVAMYLFMQEKTPIAWKLFAHPVITAALSTFTAYAALAKLTGQSIAVVLSSYYGGGLMGPGDILSSLVGTAIISFGVTLFEYRTMLFNNIVRFLSTTLFTAIFSVFSSAGANRLLKVPPAQSRAMLTRSITTPLALACASIIGSDKTLTSSVSLIAGIIGASVGEKVLKKININDNVSQGIAIGGASHSLGAAAVANNPIKFSSAIVSMCLTGIWTVVLLSQKPIRDLAMKISYGA